METKFDMNEWKRIREHLRNRHPELKEVDLIWGRTSRNELIEMISAKLGKSKKELMDEIESFRDVLSE
ncbi:HU family DNA-binding protein [Maribellus maritimus]|uniref:hypothetical protein n=1 Tax=Maribellus maritimus TaxID=2870838 RepID=UPI001EEA7386|nr:hypothetical protein [Maribellus maritimus]MCG6191278.1 hypothetical protein [Maribellus maritimus]